MRRELQDSWDLDGPELAPDLAWLLSSGAASPAMLAEALVREHYSGLYELALDALTYPEEAERLADEIILAAAAEAPRYSADQDVWAWLEEIAWHRLERRQAELARLECLNPQLAKAYLQRWSPRPVNAQFLNQTVQRLGQKNLRGSGRMQIKEILLATAGTGLALLLIWGAVNWLDRAPSRSTSRAREKAMMEAVGSITATASGAGYPPPGMPKDGPHRRGEASGFYSIGPGLNAIERADSSGSRARFSAVDLPALSRFSSHEDVWRRMLLSRYLWRTMWADVWIILHGPEGYLGPARGRRHQVWVDQAQERVREISGPMDGGPDEQEFLGQAEEDRIRNLKGVDDFARLGSQIPWFYLNGQEVLVSPFLRNIYFLAHHDWPPTHERFKVTGEVSWNGRPVVIVERFNLRGRREARYWLDRQLGIAYREQYFSGRDEGSVLLEVYVLNFEFNSTFPEGLLDEARAAHLPPTFARNSKGEPDVAGAGRPEFFYPLGKTEPPGRLLSPPDLDLGRSVLTFLPPRGMPPQPSRLSGLLLFADGNYLGDIALGDTNTTLCRRSADGMQIAFARGPLTETADPTLRWFRLDDLRIQTELFPGAVISVFDFAPDNRRLAVATIQNRGKRSEVFIIDSKTGARTQLPLLEPVWGLAWKPDGSALVALEAPQLSNPSEFLVQTKVIDLENDHVTTGQTRSELDWSATQITIPLTDWEARFDFPMGGLEACSSPPGS